MTTPITQELETAADPDNATFGIRYNKFLIDAACLYFHANRSEMTADKAADLFDRDDAVDGYSLDGMFDRYRQGMTAEEAVSCLPA